MIKATAKMNDNGTVGIDVIAKGNTRDIIHEMCGILYTVVSHLEKHIADGVTTDAVIDTIAEAAKIKLNARSETE